MARRTGTELCSTATQAMPLSRCILHSRSYFGVTFHERCFIDWIIFLYFQAQDIWKHPRLSKKTSLFSFRSFSSKAIMHCILWIWFHLIYEATVQSSCCRFNDFSVLLPKISSYVNLSLAFWMPFTYLQGIILFMPLYHVNWVVVLPSSSLT